MKTYLDCLPCFLDQALRAARTATDDERKIKEILDRVGGMLKDIPMHYTPPQTGELIYELVKEVTGDPDPYHKIKQENIEEALQLYPDLKKRISDSGNPLLTAIRIAIAGNVIDLGVKKEFDLLRDIEKILKQDFAIFHFEQFLKSLKAAGSILYIGDNCGESVFDRILIEEMGKPLTYVVRDIPIINDVTHDDAIASGIDRVADIISSGTTAPGLVLEYCKPDFLKRFEEADMIISKGQGNFESLSEIDREVFFLLKAKCSVVASHLSVQEGDIILKSSLI